jgi:hypothetical protein
MSLLLILKNWKEASIAFLGVVLAIVWGLFKYKSAQLDKAEHEIKVKDKVAEITTKQEEFQAKVISDEQEEILQGIEENAKKTKSNIFDSL